MKEINILGDYYMLTFLVILVLAAVFYAGYEIYKKGVPATVTEFEADESTAKEDIEDAVDEVEAEAKSAALIVEKEAKVLTGKNTPNLSVDK